MGSSISLALIGAVFIVFFLAADVISFTFPDADADAGTISVGTRIIKESSIIQNFVCSLFLGTYIFLSLLFQLFALKRFAFLYY